MKILCSMATSSSFKVKTQAYVCLISFIKGYYQFLQQYIQKISEVFFIYLFTLFITILLYFIIYFVYNLLKVAIAAINNHKDLETGKLAVEFYSSLCDKETELLESGEEDDELMKDNDNNNESDDECHHLIASLLPLLIPALLHALTLHVSFHSFLFYNLVFCDFLTFFFRSFFFFLIISIIIIINKGRKVITFTSECHMPRRNLGVRFEIRHFEFGNRAVHSFEFARRRRK